MWNYCKFICNTFSWDTVKIGIIIKAKVRLSISFKMMGYSRVSSTCMGIVNLLLVKCRQGLSNCIKNPHCFLSIRICVCLNRTKPWLELSIKFNQYSLRSFQKALVGFNNLWIHLVFKEFNWVSMSKIPIPPFQVESWTRCLGGLNFCSSRGNFICFFSVSFLIYFRIVYTWPMYHSFDERI